MSHDVQCEHMETIRTTKTIRTRTSEAAGKTGEHVVLMGWVQVRRDHGKLIFIDLRDRWGMVQVVFSPAHTDVLARANNLRTEWVVRVEGLVKQRPEKMINPNVPTGGIEIEATELEIINESKTPPFAVDTDGHEIGEEHRMQYRYLDLRRARMIKNLMLRDRLISFIREYLHKEDFIEIETPLLTKSTPEGARDYVVPARLYPGKFYALPQSPQQYKQLLMVGGVERYFQIARCFRDEDTRGDRQPEHTQLDVEMSFVERDEILALLEKLMIALVNAVAPEKKISQIPFPRMSHQEAMEKYNSDKPDLRMNKDDPNELAFCWIVDFPMFEKDEKTKKWTHGHNPFSGIREDSVDDLLAEKNIGGIMSNQYDLALNGYELGSGSIRNHRVDLLEKVFAILGHTPEETRENFGHILDAFSFGVPPHGGMAWGIDRIAMLILGEPNIREVIAFPKTGDARDLMMDSPAEIRAGQLKELHLRIEKI